MLSELLTCKEVSIYCFINELDKRVFITYSIETVPSILYNIQKIKTLLQEDRNNVAFRIIETYNAKNRLYLKWRVQELYQEYKEQGYSFYTIYKPLQWKMYVGIRKGTGTPHSVQYKAIVKLRTSNNIVHDVKVFDTMLEATEFVQGNTISTMVRLL